MILRATISQTGSLRSTRLRAQREREGAIEPCHLSRRDFAIRKQPIDRHRLNTLSLTRQYHRKDVQLRASPHSLCGSQAYTVTGGYKRVPLFDASGAGFTRSDRAAHAAAQPWR